MKKFGFTLAEVLITLAIIGFIASVTLPSLTTGVGDRQAIVAFKKSFNTLTNVAQMTQAIDGTDFASITNTSQFRDAIWARANTERKLEAADTKDAGKANSKEYGTATNQAIFFRDGTTLIFPNAAALQTHAKEINPSDNIVNGCGVIIDTNGKKGPNKISYCGEDKESNKIEDCDSLRYIHDQFSVKIRGSLIVPNNDAAAWALKQ